MSAVSSTRNDAPDAATLSLASAPREIEHLFQLSLFLLILTGFGTLAATGKLDLFSLVCVLTVLSVRGILLLRDKAVGIPRSATSWLALVYLLIFVADFFFFSARDFVTPAVHLVLFGMCVKLFNIERERDYIYLALLSFLMVLSAAILTVDSTFLAAFCLFVVLAVFWFMALELRRSAMTASNRASLVIPGLRKRHRRISPLHRLGFSLARSTVVMVAGIAASATVLFFIMPRLGGGYISRHIPTDAISVGYSDTVDLGVIGRIQQSSEVVAHVHIEGDTTGDRIIRLRGSALSHFDGKRWSNTQHETQVLSRGYDRAFQLASFGTLQHQAALRLARGPKADLVHYRVLMEPTSASVIFTIPTAQALFGSFREVGVDDDLTFHSLDADHAVTLYEGLSDASVPLPTTLTRLRDEPFTPSVTDGARLEKTGNSGPSASDADFLARYLQLPDSLDPRIPELARQIAGSQPNRYLEALAIERYLSTEYSYTLQLPSRPPEDPVAYFLFERRAGHCEYFASAMSILLRTVGIPSRVINGFRGAQFNQLNATYIVRASNAHSWVEAFIPGAGWVTFDPTPGGRTALPPPTAWSRLQLYLDASREFWREWIVNYDAGHQQALSVAAVRRTHSGLMELRDSSHRLYRKMLDRARRFHAVAMHNPQRLLRRATGLLLLLAIASLPFIAFHAYARWHANSPRRSPRSAATVWYLRMTRRLARSGYARPPGQTPAEFACSISDAPVRDAVLRFTAAYERARFGGSIEEAAQLPELLDQIRNALRS